MSISDLKTIGLIKKTFDFIKKTFRFKNNKQPLRRALSQHQKRKA